MTSILLVLFLGYAVQQTWFLLFEQSNWAYDSNTRPVVNLLDSYVRQREDKQNLLGLGKEEEIKKEHVYSLWESILYSENIPKNTLDKASRTWDYIHTNAANALGLFLAASGLTMLFFVESFPKSLSLLLISKYVTSPFEFFAILDPRKTPGVSLLWGAIIFAIAAVLLSIKALQTKRLVDNLEKNIARLWLANTPPAELKKLLNIGPITQKQTNG